MCNKKFVPTGKRHYFCHVNCKVAYRRKTNPEAVKAEDRRRYNRNKTSYWTVYYIPEKDYVGVTQNLNARMRNHGVKEYQVWHKCNTKKEAIQLEGEYHNIGYNGANAGHFEVGHRPHNEIKGITLFGREFKDSTEAGEYYQVNLKTALRWSKRLDKDEQLT